ncbi:MAG: type IV toxin-antitoxin system AbiEi family antitoxin domain-containing protein [Chthoniobacteraceae bacterium]|jgi:predicted transcriptional regulator of viral defense system
MNALLAKPDSERLFEIAESQQGYFSTPQALAAGYARSTHSYHVEAGNWVREHRGIYRLRKYPLSEEGQLVLWSIWSRNREGKPQGVYSHLTALSVKELSDANPAKLQMTVPPDFRRSGEAPATLRLHKAQLAPDEIIEERGYAVTTPMRAILDLAASGDADHDLITQAFREGQSRGLITRKQAATARARSDIPAWLRRLMEIRH